MAPLAEALAAAAARVARVAAGHSLGEPAEPAGPLRGAVTDLCHGTLRRYGRSQAIVRLLSHRGGSADPALEALLWCALYALESGRYAEHTVLDQAVRAAELMRQPRGKPYVNAILRSFLRARRLLEPALHADPQARYCHPGWWIERVRADHPHAWEDVLAGGNTHPPMCLRVNRRRASPEEYAERLRGEGLASRLQDGGALLLEKPVPAARLPGFAQGDVSVQDAGAQRAGACLALEPGQRVLDACAAPGGKSAHILELAEVSLTALDADAGRLAAVEANLRRLDLRAELRAADCAEVPAWWDGRPYERILADVPCSASGVARRHPDMKWLRRAADLPAFAARQARILDALWRVLGPGGKLLYVTCSVFEQENGGAVQAFLARHAEARRAPLPDGGAAQLLPGPAHDGFFLALLEKPA